MNRKFLLIPWKSKILAIKVLTLYLFYSLISMIVPFHVRSKNIGKQNMEMVFNLNVKEKQQSYFLYKIIGGINKYLTLKFSCMVQAQTAAFILRNKNIPYILYLGVKKENNKLKAHSWLMVENLTITGGNKNDYNIVSFFSHQKKENNSI